MATLQERIGPPETQSIVLRMPWEQWIRIRDLARTHQRSASAEIRMAIDSWWAMHEWERELTERNGG